MPPTLIPPSPSAFTPTPLPPPTAEQAWTAVQPALDSVWGVDSQASITLLDSFYTRFPDYPPVREKLYAALLANASDLARSGATKDAAELLTHATAIAPERAEGLVALQALTPTSIPVLPPETEVPSVTSVQERQQGSPTEVTSSPAPRAPAPASARPTPTPVPRPVVVPPPPPQVLPPTPTKSPFRPPPGP